MKKAVGFLFTVTAFMILFSSQALAGEWQNYYGVWTYNATGNEFLIGNGWHEVDGKQYYFYNRNEALKNSVTPDGYVVGEDCAWVKDAPLSSVKCGKTFLVPDVVTTVPAAGKIRTKTISYASPAMNENSSYSGTLDITVDGITTAVPLEEESYGYCVWAADLNPADDCENLVIEVLLKGGDVYRTHVLAIADHIPVQIFETAGTLKDFEPAGDGTVIVYRFDSWGVHSFGSFGRKQKISVNSLTAEMTESLGGTMRFDTYSFDPDYVCTARKEIILTDRTGNTVTGRIPKGAMFLITEAWDADTGDGNVWFRIRGIEDKNLSGWNRHLIDEDNPLIEGTGYLEKSSDPESENASGNGKEGAVMTDRGMQFTFAALPKTREELEALPEAVLETPFQTAALTVAALCHYGENPEETLDMIRFLKGPNPLSVYETQFLRDRLGGKDYVPRSFFAGTSPDNSYTPDVPYVITVEEDPYSYAQDGYAKLLIRSSGADSARPVKLVKKDGKWYLWENMLLSDIRKPV